MGCTTRQLLGLQQEDRWPAVEAGMVLAPP